MVLRAHIPITVFYKHNLSLVIWKTHWKSKENNSRRNVSGFFELWGVCKGFSGWVLENKCWIKKQRESGLDPKRKGKETHGQDSYFGSWAGCAWGLASGVLTPWAVIVCVLILQSFHVTCFLSLAWMNQGLWEFISSSCAKTPLIETSTFQKPTLYLWEEFLGRKDA